MLVHFLLKMPGKVDGLVKSFEMAMEDEMNQTAEEKKHTILCVDDEDNILKALWRVLRKENYNILRATSAEEGLELLKENEVHLVLSDQRMPGMDGIEFFANIKELYPDTIRIILSGYTEISSITDSINKGHIYKFFLKPWNDDNIKIEIQKALEQYDLIQANKSLNQTIVKQNKELKEINDNLEITVEKRTRTLKLKNQALQLSQAVLEELPYPVLCVGSDNLIVLINKKVRDLFQQYDGGFIGEQAIDLFGQEIVSSIESTLSAGVSAVRKSQELLGGTYDIYLSPMSGQFKGQGVIISIIGK